MQLITTCTSMKYAQYYSPKAVQVKFQVNKANGEEEKHPYCNEMGLHV